MSTLPTYPEYKDSGETWLGQVPSTWEVYKIGHLSPVRRGASPRPIDEARYFDEEGEYAWTRIADVTASDVYLTESPQRLSTLGASLSVKLQPGELFLSIAATVGKPCITAIKACIHDGFVYFPELKIPNKFLFYIFAAGQAYKGLGKMGTQLNLNTDTVAGIKVGIGTLAEIAQIVRFLDYETARIDTLIEKQQQLIGLLKEKRQAVISHAVTKGLNPNAPLRDSGVEWLGMVPAHWAVAKLARFIRVGSGEFLPSSEYTAEREEGARTVPVVGGNGVSGWAKRSNSPAGTLVIGRVGALCGNVHLLQEISWVTDNALRVEFTSRFESEYLAQILRVRNLNDVADKSAQPLITGTRIKAQAISIPPLVEQLTIVERIRAMVPPYDELVNRASQAVALLQERRTAIISAAVTGKIDVRGWSPPESKAEQNVA